MTITKYEKEIRKRLREDLGKDSPYLKQRAAHHRALDKYYRLGDSAKEDYLRHMGFDSLPEYSCDGADKPESEAPQGSFKFNNVCMETHFTKFMTKMKKYKMVIVVEHCHDGYMSGYGVET